MKIKFCIIIILIILTGCEPQWFSISDYDKYRPKVKIEYLSKLSNPSQEEAEALAWDYIKEVIDTKKISEDSIYFTAYFFKPKDVDTIFRFINYNEGWNKIPGSLTVEFKNGLRLLFCYNKMVININKSKYCDCPYDFNWEPKLK